MPSDLGKRVRAAVLQRHNVLGPIIYHPRSQRWTYIVRPDIDPDVTMLAELFRIYVSVSQHGGQIALPSPADLHMSFRMWEECPTDSFRPSGAEMIALIREHSDSGRGKR
ncbi:hypothetical protein [Nocardia sp. GAS34]|uniref:hypothetical protein n=1 Tax=unclassified Nocardia TaxID=2637762 RepID=UPI003D215925